MPLDSILFDILAPCSDLPDTRSARSRTTSFVSVAGDPVVFYPSLLEFAGLSGWFFVVRVASDLDELHLPPSRPH